jgi:DNA-binding PadR family transcriptional regulator
MDEWTMGWFHFGPWRRPGGGRGWPGMQGFGRRFGMGPERIFGRGDMKYLLLELLLERPKHGYEMIKELEARFSGFYSPSPGSVYPTLQMLEDRAYVRSTTEDGKRVYAITDEGRAYLEARSEGRGHHRRGPWDREFVPAPEVRAFGREVFEFGRAVVQAARSSSNDPERLARLRGVIDHARREIYAIMDQPPRSSKAEAERSGEESQPRVTEV